jgi:hypothetical protein
MSRPPLTQRNPEMFDIAFPNSTPSDNTGRCVAMVVPQRDGDLPAYRCVRVGVREIDGKLVCAAHGGRLAVIRYWDQPAN